MSKALCAKLVNLSAGMSCGKSVRVGEAEVSRQTVSNKVNALREVVRDVERVEETPEELHLFRTKTTYISRMEETRSCRW